jgi:hypothetical protein
VIDGKHEAHFSWALRQVQWLHANGRMFAERDHVHTLLYRYLGEVGSDPRGVPPELALDHPYAGLVATVVEHGDDADQLAPLTDGPGLTLAFAPIPLPDGAPVSQHGLTDLDRRTLVLTFLAGDPANAWPGHRATCAALEAGRPGTRVLWSAPFIPTIPGTDTYTDQLW